MHYRQRLFLAVMLIAGGLLASLTGPALAHAEQCTTLPPAHFWETTPQGQICLLADTSQPLLPGAALQFRVPADTNHFYAISCLADSMWTLLGHCESAALPTTLVTQGPPGGTSVWQATLAPWFTSADGPLAIETETSSISCDSMGANCTGGSGRATFTATGLAVLVGARITIRRTKRRVTAVYRYEGRTTLKATAQLWLDSFDSEDVILTHRGTTLNTAPGPSVVRVTLPRSVVKRKCKSHAHCSVLATGQAWSSSFGARTESYQVDSSDNRKRVK
jgi:hypothetical protein